MNSNMNTKELDENACHIYLFTFYLCLYKHNNTCNNTIMCTPIFYYVLLCPVRGFLRGTEKDWELPRGAIVACRDKRGEKNRKI